MTGAMINAMTVDVEDYFHVSAFADNIDRSEWDNKTLRVAANTRRLLEIFSEAEIHATFFVLGWVADRLPDLVREIDAAGHEVASHGWSHTLVYDQTPEEFERETRRSKATLEDAIGKAVSGYRAASYSITRRSLWALDILAELGFQYDSSIFPVRHDRYGIPGSERWPHVIRMTHDAPLVEFPISTAAIAGMRLPVAGGGYFRLFPYQLSRWGLASINGQGRPFVFYIHPWEVDPDQPRVPNASFGSRLRHYTNLDRCEKRLRQLVREFSFGTCRDVLGRLDLLSPAAPEGSGARALA